MRCTRTFHRNVLPAVEFCEARSALSTVGPLPSIADLPIQLPVATPPAVSPGITVPGDAHLGFGRYVFVAPDATGVPAMPPGTLVVLTPYWQSPQTPA